MKDRNYWQERGKNGPIKEGFICIGAGYPGKPLEYQDERLSKNLWMGSSDGLYSGAYRGDSPTVFYYIETKIFNQLFPVKTKQQEIDELLAKVEKLKQEIEEDRFKIGDVLFAEVADSTFILKVSEIRSNGYFAEKYFCLDTCKNRREGLFTFSHYKFTKINL